MLKTINFRQGNKNNDYLFYFENVHFTYALQYFKQVQINVFVTWQDDFNNILVAKHIPYMCPVISNLISIPTLVNM